MEFALSNLDVTKCHLCTWVGCWLLYQWFVVLSVMVSCGHARWTGCDRKHFLCRSAGEAMWNNLMKWFLSHLPQLGQSVPRGPKPISITFFSQSVIPSPLHLFLHSPFTSDALSSVRPWRGYATTSSLCRRTLWSLSLPIWKWSTWPASCQVKDW